MEPRGTLFLLATLSLLSSSDSVAAKVVTLIDGYTPTSVLVSPATVPLGTTVVLVCRVGGVAFGTQLNYTWTCPTSHCNIGMDLGPFSNRQTYQDRMVINAISPDDSGSYSCLVAGHSGEELSTESFNLTVTDDLFLYSSHRLIPDNAVITSMDTIDTHQGGVVSCYSPLQGGRPVWSGPPGINLTTLADPESEGTVSLVVSQSNFTNGQYCCHGGGDSHCVNVYTSGGGTLATPRINAMRDSNRQWALVATVGAVEAAQRFVVAYARQDFDVPLKVEYIQSSISSLNDYIISKPANTTVAGVRYEISVWALNGEEYSGQPFEHTIVLRDDTVPSAPRSPMVVRAFRDTYELSWIPPQEPHGEVQYTVKYSNTHNMTEGQSNTTGEHYYNLTGLIPGGSYRITVGAMNSVGLGAESEAVEFTMPKLGTPPNVDTEQPTPATSSQNTGAIITSVVLVAFLLLLVGVIATVILLLVLLTVKRRQSKKKKKWALRRDTSLYSTADYTYASVYEKPCSVSVSMNIYDTVDAVSIKEPLEPTGVTHDHTRETLQANGMPLDSTGQCFTTAHISTEIAEEPFDGTVRVTEGAAEQALDATAVPLDSDSSESGYQELMEACIQKSLYANLYSSLPLRKEEQADPGPQNVVDATESKWVGEDRVGGEGDKQENPYVNAATVAMQQQK